MFQGDDIESPGYCWWFICSASWLSYKLYGIHIKYRLYKVTVKSGDGKNMYETSKVCVLDRSYWLLIQKKVDKNSKEKYYKLDLRITSFFSNNASSFSCYIFPIFYINKLAWIHFRCNIIRLLHAIFIQNWLIGNGRYKRNKNNNSNNNHKTDGKVSWMFLVSISENEKWSVIWVFFFALPSGEEH